MALTDSGEQNEKMVHAGIYVTVLMVAGGLQTLHSLRRRCAAAVPGLPVRDAVPLSKAVVFIGSISSLFLNLRQEPC